MSLCAFQLSLQATYRVSSGAQRACLEAVYRQSPPGLVRAVLQVGDLAVVYILLLLLHPCWPVSMLQKQCPATLITQQMSWARQLTLMDRHAVKAAAGQQVISAHVAAVGPSCRAAQEHLTDPPHGPCWALGPLEHCRHRNMPHSSGACTFRKWADTLFRL